MRRQRGGGFWLFEIVGSFGRWFVNLFRSSQDPEALVRAVREKTADQVGTTYDTGVQLIKHRLKLEGMLTNQLAELDRLRAQMASAVEHDDDVQAQALDQQMQILQPVIQQLQQQLSESLDSEAAKRIVSQRIAVTRLKEAQARGYAATIYSNQMMEQVAGWQEELAGIGATDNVWEIDELKERAEEGADEVKARLQLSSHLAQQNTDSGYAFGEKSSELKAMIAERQKKKGGASMPATQPAATSAPDLLTSLGEEK